MGGLLIIQSRQPQVKGERQGGRGRFRGHFLEALGGGKFAGGLGQEVGCQPQPFSQGCGCLWEGLSGKVQAGSLPWWRESGDVDGGVWASKPLQGAQEQDWHPPGLRGELCGAQHPFFPLLEEQGSRGMLGKTCGP